LVGPERRGQVQRCCGLLAASTLPAGAKDRLAEVRPLGLLPEQGTSSQTLDGVPARWARTEVLPNAPPGGWGPRGRSVRRAAFGALPLTQDDACQIDRRTVGGREKEVPQPGQAVAPATAAAAASTSRPKTTSTCRPRNELGKKALKRLRGRRSSSPRTIGLPARSGGDQSSRVAKAWKAAHLPRRFGPLYLRKGQTGGRVATPSRLAHENTRGVAGRLRAGSYDDAVGRSARDAEIGRDDATDDEFVGGEFEGGFGGVFGLQADPDSTVGEVAAER